MVLNVNVNMQVNILDSLIASAKQDLTDKTREIGTRKSEHSIFLEHTQSLIEQIKTKYESQIQGLETQSQTIITDMQNYPSDMESSQQELYQSFIAELRAYYDQVKQRVDTTLSDTDVAYNQFTESVNTAESQFTNVQLEPMEMTFQYKYLDKVTNEILTQTTYPFSGYTMAEIEQQKKDFPEWYNGESSSLQQFVEWVGDSVSASNTTQNSTGTSLNTTDQQHFVTYNLLPSDQ